MKVISIGKQWAFLVFYWKGAVFIAEHIRICKALNEGSTCILAMYVCMCVFSCMYIHVI